MKNFYVVRVHDGIVKSRAADAYDLARAESVANYVNQTQTFFDGPGKAIVTETDYQVGDKIRKEQA